MSLITPGRASKRKSETLPQPVATGAPGSPQAKQKSEGAARGPLAEEKLEAYRMMSHALVLASIRAELKVEEERLETARAQTLHVQRRQNAIQEEYNMNAAEIQAEHQRASGGPRPTMQDEINLKAILTDVLYKQVDSIPDEVENVVKAIEKVKRAEARKKRETQEAHAMAEADKAKRAAQAGGEPYIPPAPPALKKSASKEGAAGWKMRHTWAASNLPKSSNGSNEDGEEESEEEEEMVDEEHQFTKEASVVFYASALQGRAVPVPFHTPPFGPAPTVLAMTHTQTPAQTSHGLATRNLVALWSARAS